jgi:hypothetical protein
MFLVRCVPENDAPQVTNGAWREMARWLGLDRGSFERYANQVDYRDRDFCHVTPAARRDTRSSMLLP